MNGASVFLIAFFTAVFAATGTVFVIQRTNLLAAPQVEQQLAAVPNLKGLLEEDAVTNLRAAGLVMTISAREPSLEMKPGSVLRQAVPAGQNIPKGQAVGVTLATESPTVPDVLGRAFAEASVLLEQAGYRAQKGDSVVDEKAAEGTVLKQVPAAGSPQDKGKAVLLQLAAGVPLLETPKLVGLTLANAKTQLQKVGLTAGTIRWSFVDRAGYSVVLSQEPKPGSKLKPGAEVALTVNRD
jgi:beta-lactam-binding protein with PASTA domain